MKPELVLAFAFVLFRIAAGEEPASVPATLLSMHGTMIVLIDDKHGVEMEVWGCDPFEGASEILGGALASVGFFATGLSRLRAVLAQPPCVRRSAQLDRSLRRSSQHGVVFQFSKSGDEYVPGGGICLDTGTESSVSPVVA